MIENQSPSETYQNIQLIEKRADLWAAYTGVSGSLYFMLEFLKQPAIFFSELTFSQRHTVFFSVMIVFMISNVGIINSYIQARRYRKKSGMNYFYHLISFAESELAVPECEFTEQTKIACDFLERYNDLPLRHYHFFMKKIQWAEEHCAVPQRDEENRRIFISNYVGTLKRNNE